MQGGVDVGLAPVADTLPPGFPRLADFLITPTLGVLLQRGADSPYQGLDISPFPLGVAGFDFLYSSHYCSPFILLLFACQIQRHRLQSMPRPLSW